MVSWCRDLAAAAELGHCGAASASSEPELDLPAPGDRRGSVAEEAEGGGRCEASGRPRSGLLAPSGWRRWPGLSQVGLLFGV